MSGAGTLGRRLVDNSWHVRRHALYELAQFPPEVLALHTVAIAERLCDEHDDVCWASLIVLAILPPDVLAPYVPTIVLRLGDANRYVRWAALGVLAKLPPKLLGLHVTLIAQQLGKDLDVRKKVFHVLAQLPPDVLGRHAATIVAQLGDQDEVVRNITLETLVKLDRDVLTKYVLRWMDDRGCTALHIAAEQGHLKLCQTLVHAGAFVRMKDYCGHMPEDLAQQSGHAETFDFLKNCQSLGTMRGCGGDALAPALADDRPIIMVEWYTIPLLGIVGSAGVLHSFLAITVDGEPEPTYVIEKAAGYEIRLEQGVCISHFADVRMCIEDPAIHTLNVGDTANTELRMRTLWSVAIGLGPHDVGRCNCHHAALALYNACAKETAHVTEIPNQTFTWVAHGLRGFAWVVHGLQCMGVDVTSSNSASPKPGLFPIDGVGGSKDCEHLRNNP